MKIQQQKYKGARNIVRGADGYPIIFSSVGDGNGRPFKIRLSMDPVALSKVGARHFIHGLEGAFDSPIAFGYADSHQDSATLYRSCLCWGRTCHWRGRDSPRDLPEWLETGGGEE